jgi:hypothetical protein
MRAEIASLSRENDDKDAQIESLNQHLGCEQDKAETLSSELSDHKWLCDRSCSDHMSNRDQELKGTEVLAPISPFQKPLTSRFSIGEDVYLVPASRSPGLTIRAARRPTAHPTERPFRICPTIFGGWTASVITAALPRNRRI